MQLVVVIVNYNSTSLVQRCLEALAQQTRSPDRIVVVDNASTDPGTRDAFAALAAIDVIYNEENRGYGAAINQVCDGLAVDDLLVCLNPVRFLSPTVSLNWRRPLVSTPTWAFCDINAEGG